LTERGVSVDPSTIYAWVQAFTPHFIAAARTHRLPLGGRWRVDEPYLKIGGRQRYLVGALDEHGQIIDVFLSDRRDAAAARAFFARALDASGVCGPASRPIKPRAIPLRCVPCSRELSIGVPRI
jgi:transposase-like protein